MVIFNSLQSLYTKFIKNMEFLSRFLLFLDNFSDNFGDVSKNIGQK